MTGEEDFIIEQPYQPTKAESEAISELVENGLNAKDWDSQKTSIKSFKKNLRHDMYNKQNQRCAYCRIHVPIACVPMHREHIVYKDAHPQWMFLPKNLCIACPTCNEFKGTTEVLTDPSTMKYPKDGSGFRIIHPMYDKYSDNIELVGGILYRGKTAKGKFTIETCHLYRVSLAEERADILYHDEHKDSIITQLISLASTSGTYVNDCNELMEHVKEIVKKYKQALQNNAY